VDFPLLSFPFAIVLLGILYLIDIHTSDGQHKEPQCQCGEQRGEKQCCQPAAAPPPTLEQVLAMQAQMLQTIQHTIVNMQNAQPQAPPPLPRDRLGDFQCTKPLTFSHVVEMMNADDWLKSVEKLQLVQYNNREKVLLASHQLSRHIAN
jgi:hypothetical protein